MHTLFSIHIDEFMDCKFSCMGMSRNIRQYWNNQKDNADKLH